jgi:hypothetical protein
MPTFRNTLFHLHRQVGVCTHAYLPVKMEQSVPKRRYINFSRWGITQKKEHNRCVVVARTEDIFKVEVKRAPVRMSGEK